MEKKTDKKTKKTKPFFEESVNCAWCGKPNKVTAIKEVIVPATPAQKTIEVFAEKDTQTKLNEHKKK